MILQANLKRKKDFAGSSMVSPFFRVDAGAVLKKGARADLVLLKKQRLYCKKGVQKDTLRHCVAFRF
jgi:hypothetical protein